MCMENFGVFIQQNEKIYLETQLNIQWEILV